MAGGGCLGLEDGRPGWGAPARLSRPVPVPCRRWSAVPGPPDPRPAITPTAEFANPMYGGAEEGAKPANPVYDSGDSPLAPAAGGYPGAAGTAGPSGETRGGRLGVGWVRWERCSVLHVTLPVAWAWHGSTTSAPPSPLSYCRLHQHGVWGGTGHAQGRHGAVQPPLRHQHQPAVWPGRKG